VNGDGNTDLITSNEGASSVSVLLGNGNGTFQPHLTYAAGSFPTDVSAADVNGDGEADLIVTNFGSNTVSLLLGNGDGTFQPQQTYATGAAPTSVTTADVNDDSRPDVIVADHNGNTVSLLLNQPEPATGPTFTIDRTAPQLVSIIATDATPTNDAMVHYTVTFSELVTGVDASQFSVVTTGESSASIASVTEVPGSGGMQYSVAVSSGTGDGTITLQFTGVGVRDLAGNGLPGGNFDPAQSYGTGNQPISVVSADINGDGRADLVVANNGSDTV
jgi:FG-GAP-like repeat/FG-GAP repeat